MDTNRAVAALSALAQTSRLAVFQALVAAGTDGALPSEIAQTLDIPANTLSFHLKTLLHAELVTAEPSGRRIRYRANFARVQGLVDFLTKNCCGGDLSQCAPVSGCAPNATAGAR
ncbi:ArsR/SmtB family transcription factor [Cognatilysobacter bugurensis]|uniref:Transcriptional regulator n=1 Tax=Cognatilysobacter bugurensis TaxID=543356 RepID=A0A918W9J9_9GAMM|nr:metalloregulator ArsR/SmtB family transcription factor [Lysobacter bugurensis]GHA80273.1 transcriptional regulator [Lysobacter bugurensis]